MTKTGILRGQIVFLIMRGLFFLILSGELLARVFSADLLLLRKALYYQAYGPAIHRVSADPRRLYELVPNAFARDPFAHAKETKYKGHDTTINELGFRGKTQPRLKKPDVYRIIVFGGSNTFGIAVGDEDTYPAQMQKIFDVQYPGKVEVWNAGISAYVMSQMVAYAETAIKEFDPDLVIFQDKNQGRRAFHYNVTFKELKELFRQNKELFVENIPFLWQQHVPPAQKAQYFFVSTGIRIHRSLVRSSALYRTLCLSLYYGLGVFTNSPHSSARIAEKYRDIWAYEGQRISDRELKLFEERHRKKKIVLFVIGEPAEGTGYKDVAIRRNLESFILNTNGKAPEYQDMHPPSYVYAWYARELCDFLVQKGYLPAGNLNPKKPGP